MKRALLGAVAAALLVLTLPAAANAQTRVHIDPADDVWYVDEGAHTAPAEVGPDVRKVWFQHGRKLVRMIVTFGSEPDYHGALVPMSTDFYLQNGRGRLLLFRVGADSTFQAKRFPHGYQAPWASYHCRGARYKANPATHRVALTIPRKCVGNPRYLRLSLNVVGWGPPEPPPLVGGSLSYDDGYSTEYWADVNYRHIVSHSKWTMRG
jgi:hypothetical protein